MMVASAFAQDADRPLVDPVEQKYRAESLRSLLQPETRVFLYAIDPRLPRGRVPAGREMFHGFRVLGRTEIKDASEKQTLVDALAAGVAESEGVVAFCFEPRHGLRFEREGVRVDLNICFECLQVRPYGTEGDRTILVTRTPQAVFDASLKKHGLPKPKA